MASIAASIAASGASCSLELTSLVGQLIVLLIETVCVCGLLTRWKNNPNILENDCKLPCLVSSFLPFPYFHPSVSAVTMNTDPVVAFSLSFLFFLPSDYLAVGWKTGTHLQRSWSPERGRQRDGGQMKRQSESRGWWDKPCRMR